jgi:5-formyltetrahydrofolate cyclo-ligase
MRVCASRPTQSEAFPRMLGTHLVHPGSSTPRAPPVLFAAAPSRAPRRARLFWGAGPEAFVLAAKKAQRRAMKESLAALPKERFAAGGAAIARHLAPHLQGLNVVACFASRDHELATAPLVSLLRAGNTKLALPRIDGETLSFVVVDDVEALPRDRWGLASPDPDAVALDPRALSLVLVPGLAFDDGGGRLGYGRGFYDRLLADDVVNDRAIGLFLDEQRMDQVVCEAHDVALRRLCTPSRGLWSIQTPKPSGDLALP